MGDLAEMPLADFAQVLALGRKTVKVALDSAWGRGEVYFEHGTPVAAFSTQNRGPHAFVELLGWPEGSFRLVNAEGAPERNLYHGLEALLLMGATAAQPQQEEWAQEGAAPAGPEASEDGLMFAEEAGGQNPYASSGQGSYFHNPYSTPTQTHGGSQPTFPPPPDDDNPYGPG